MMCRILDCKIEDIMEYVETHSDIKPAATLASIAAITPISAPADNIPAPDKDDLIKRLASIRPGMVSLRVFRDMAESAFIQETLKINGQSVSKAADMLGIERTNLHKKIKKYESPSGFSDDDD